MANTVFWCVTLNTPASLNGGTVQYWNIAMDGTTSSLNVDFATPCSLVLSHNRTPVAIHDSLFRTVGGVQVTPSSTSLNGTTFTANFSTAPAAGDYQLIVNLEF